MFPSIPASIVSDVVRLPWGEITHFTKCSENPMILIQAPHSPTFSLPTALGFLRPGLLGMLLLFAVVAYWKDSAL